LEAQQHLAPDKEEKISPLSSGRRVIDTFGNIIFFVIVIEIILLFGLNLYQKSRISALTKQLGEKQAQLNQPENRVINTQIEEVLEGQDALSRALKSKVKWANFYSQLNAVTPKNVRFTSVSLNDSGVFRGDGFTPTMSDLARALVAWQTGAESIATPFSSLELNNNGFITQGSQRLVSFSVSGQINLGGLGR